MAPGRWERRSKPAFEHNVDRLIQAYRVAGLPVMFFLHTDGDPGFEPSSPFFKLEEIIRRTVFVLRGRFARITSVDQLIGELEEAGALSAANARERAR